MMEVWKDITEFQGMYQVSSLGRIKSFRGKTERILQLTISKRGYYVVGLWRNQKNRLCTIHRLVALHFIDNPGNKREVNHIDSNKLNNSVSNLEWATPKENSYHAINSEKSRKFFHKRGAYKSGNSWSSQIRLDNKFFYLGSFKTKDDAQQAYFYRYVEHYGFAPWLGDAR